MRSHGIAVALAAALVVPAVSAAQDASRPVAGGGIQAPGWMGKIDKSEADKGAKLEDSKLVTMGQGLHVTTGPMVVYWNPANTASGNYTVEATFSEPAVSGQRLTEVARSNDRHSNGAYQTQLSHDGAT